MLADPAAAGPNALREGLLFNYNMFAYLDGDYLLKAVAHIQAGGDPRRLKEAGLVPDLGKRGAVRSVFDGRYVFSRYFSPKQHNRPAALEQLYRLNDVELYDRQADPHEMTNLAAKAGASRDLVLAMNEKLDRGRRHRGIRTPSCDHAECRLDDPLSCARMPFPADAGAMVGRLACGGLAYLGHWFGSSGWMWGL